MKGSPPPPGGDDTEPPPAEPLPPAVAPPPPAARGLFRFSVEGRNAPGLFVGGWLATLVGGSSAVIGLLAGQTLAGVILFVAGLAALFVGLLFLAGSQAIERRAAGLAYAGPSPILVFIATFVAIYLTVVAVATPLSLAGVTLSGAGLALFGVALQALAVFIVLRVLVVGPGGLTWREMGLVPGRAAAIRDLLWGAVFAAPVVVVTGIGVAVLVNLIGQTPESPLPPTGTSTGLVINLIAGAVIAPISEELLFRGFATTAWARMIRPVGAIVRTSLLFALAHAIDQQAATFAAGAALALVASAARLPVAFALGWVFIRRRSLWAAIGLHATFNAILIVAAEMAVRA